MKRFIAGFSLGCALIACAATPVFPYHFYHLSPSNAWDLPGGKLLGATPQDDHALSECRPVPGKDPQGKPVTVQRCAVVFYSELNSFISDYKQTKSDLIDCQKGN